MYYGIASQGYVRGFHLGLNLHFLPKWGKDRLRLGNMTRQKLLGSIVEPRECFIMQNAMRIGLLAAGILLFLSSRQQVTAEEAEPTLREKAAALLKLDVPGPTTYLYYPDNKDYQSTWLRSRIANTLLTESHYGYSREQILRVKQLVCVDTESIPGLKIYQSIAKWQAENEYVEDAQQTLREAVAFSKRLKANPPPKHRINGWCGCYEDTSPESRIACEMLRVGSSDEDVLSAVAQITPDWDRWQYMEEPYHELAAQLGRHDLALELVRRMPERMMAAISCERVAEEILHSGDYTLAKLAFEQTLAMIPDPNSYNWSRGGDSFLVRAAACLGHMGEYQLAEKFLKRSKELPGLRPSLSLQKRAEEYIEYAGKGDSKLPPIVKDDPEYKKKIDRAGRIHEEMVRNPLHEVMIDVVETIPADDPARYAMLSSIFRTWAGSNHDLPQPAPTWVKELLRRQMEHFPQEPTGNEPEQVEWRRAAWVIARYLVRSGILEPYRDRFSPETIEHVTQGIHQYKRMDYPAVSLDESIKNYQAHEHYDRLSWRLQLWLRNAQNQVDAQRMAGKILELEPMSTDPNLYFLVGNDLLSRQMGDVRLKSKKYSVAGEKTEKDYYLLSDLMIETYLRGEDQLAGMIAVDIIERLWLLRDQKLNKGAGTRRHNEVAAAMLILDELRP